MFYAACRFGCFLQMISSCSCPCSSSSSSSFSGGGGVAVVVLFPLLSLFFLAVVTLVVCLDSVPDLVFPALLCVPDNLCETNQTSSNWVCEKKPSMRELFLLRISPTSTKAANLPSPNLDQVTRFLRWPLCRKEEQTR